MFDSQTATLAYSGHRQPGYAKPGHYRVAPRPRPFAPPIIDPASLANTPLPPRDRFYAGLGIVIVFGFSALAWTGLASLLV